MSDHRPTARSIVHELLVNATLAGCMFEPVCEVWPKGWPHDGACDALTSAIEADRAASDAREDRLREALAMIRDSVFGTPSWEQRQIAVAALAAIPPGSDR